MFPNFSPPPPPPQMAPAETAQQQQQYYHYQQQQQQQYLHQLQLQQYYFYSQQQQQYMQNHHYPPLPVAVNYRNHNQFQHHHRQHPPPSSKSFTPHVSGSLTATNLSQPAVAAIFRCEPCDKTFTSQNSLTAHIKQHSICPHPDCGYQCTGKYMQIHKEEAHGIAKGGKVESTKVAAQPSVNVTDDDVGDAADTELLLQSVHPKLRSLDSPEDIAKWIEQRKRNYPTDSNIAKKLAEKEAKLLERKEIQLKRKQPDSNNTDDNQEGSAARDTESGTKLRFCKYFRRGKCKHADECRFSHIDHQNDRGSNNDQGENHSLHRLKKSDPPPKSKLNSTRHLLKMLLMPEISKEHSILLQSIHHIVKSDFFGLRKLPVEVVVVGDEVEEEFKEDSANGKDDDDQEEEISSEEENNEEKEEELEEEATN